MLTDVYREAPHPFYPTSDGEPMAETDFHREQMIQLITSLQDHFASRPDVYVSGNLLVYYQEGDGRKHVSPDVMVVLGINKRRRDNYKIWDEGKAPDVVIEVTSASTRSDDLGAKKGLYAFHGVREYFVFDPLRDYLPAGLRGFQLAGEDYLPLVGTTLKSQVLGLELRIVDGILRLFDPAADRLLPVREELAGRLAEALSKAEAEKARAETEKARAEAEKVRADREAARASSEHSARIEAERRAQLLEQELEAVRAQLARDRKPDR